MAIPPDRRRLKGTLLPELEEGDPPITEEEISETGLIGLLSDHERTSLCDSELQEARTHYHIGERVMLLGRKFIVYGFKRHENGNLQLVLKLTSEEIKKHPIAEKFVYIRYPQCLQTVTKME